MTLRTIETEFAEKLKDQMKKDLPLDLTLEAPLISILHPRIIKAMLDFENNPTAAFFDFVNDEYSLECFKDFSQAETMFPEVRVKFTGRPWTFHQFLRSTEKEALINFDELGAVLLSKSRRERKKGSELHDLILPIWMDYALSAELWGASGKWIRFHQRLMALFQDKNLLAGGEMIGYYPLVDSAARLESLGFKGSWLDKSYLLVLPWTFSLSDLKRLEEIILREF